MASSNSSSYSKYIPTVELQSYLEDNPAALHYFLGLLTPKAHRTPFRDSTTPILGQEIMLQQLYEEEAPCNATNVTNSHRVPDIRLMAAEFHLSPSLTVCREVDCVVLQRR